MAGRIEGLSDLEWQRFADLFPTPLKRGRGMPPTPRHKVVNTSLYVLITGCRCWMRSRSARADQGDHGSGLRSWRRTKDMTPKPCGSSSGSVVFGPQTPTRVWKTKKRRRRPRNKDVPRFQAERTVAWFQKNYRRLVVRWERLAACFKAFLVIATLHIWVQRSIVG